MYTCVDNTTNSTAEILSINIGVQLFMSFFYTSAAVSVLNSLVSQQHKIAKHSI